MAPCLPLAGALLLLLVLAVSGEGNATAPRLRGSVACLDCPAGHDLSGVVVAVRCAGDGAGLLRAARTDSRGAFDVAMPTAAAASTPCAARVLGATTEQLCAPRGLAAARVVQVPGGAPGASTSSSSYALASRLAVFTRCGPATGGGGGSAVAETRDDPDDQQQRRRRQGDAARVPEPRPMPPAMQTPAVSSAPRAGGNGSPPPLGVGGGMPLIFFFPFIPIIGIP
ncbi:unnamed protein product [Urochloa decumbens]|uniref:Uncharacterized protein n=1 Tax=Urochloa decumbens TaxID=240449 RepID=A0ABC8ZYI3_9POAL